jgi:glycine betaine/choline ABC-type transport system substrate-binding protein
MIQINAENTLSIHFINSSNSSKNDIKTFSDFIKICKNEANKPGFKNMFDDDQKQLINNIFSEISTEGNDRDVNIIAEKDLIRY